MLLLHLLLLPSALLAQQSGLAIMEPKMTSRKKRGEVWNAEFWSPAPNEQHCNVSIKDPIFHMPELPVDPYNIPYYSLFSLDSWEDTLITCLHGFVCKKLTSSGWKYWRSTLRVRKFHTTAVTNEGLLLVGGTESPTTTELLPWEGGEGPYLPKNPDPSLVIPISKFIPNQTEPTKYNRLGFTLKYKRARHCSIQTNSNTIILTGGHYDRITTPVIPTVEYSGLGAGEEVTSRELPKLLGIRVEHACGWYSVGESKVLLVTGGFTPNNILDTTEVLPLTGPGAGAWREVGRLPSPRSQTHAAKVGNLLYVIGGRTSVYDDIDEILIWDSASESWTVTGHTKTVFRKSYQVAVVPASVVAKYCSANV